MEYGHIVIANSKKGFMPALIRFFTKSKYSHSLITIPDILGVPMCVEAADIGIAPLRFDIGYLDNKDQEILIYRVLLDSPNKDMAIKEVLNHLQEGYGFLELPWFAWRAINKVFGKDIKSQNNWSQKGIICSELCISYLTNAGLAELFKEFGKGSANAEDLREIMDNNSQYFKQITKEEYLADSISK